VRWQTPITHPNIKGEEVCMNVLSEAWAPNMNVINVIEGLKMMFTGYNLESPLDETGVEWVKQRLQAMEKAV
jgi:ubiquitin-protein ligase